MYSSCLKLHSAGRVYPHLEKALSPRCKERKQTQCLIPTPAQDSWNNGNLPNCQGLVEGLGVSHCSSTPVLFKPPGNGSDSLPRKRKYSALGRRPDKMSISYIIDSSEADRKAPITAEPRKITQQTDVTQCPTIPSQPEILIREEGIKLSKSLVSYVLKNTQRRG